PTADLSTAQTKAAAAANYTGIKLDSTFSPHVSGAGAASGEWASVVVGDTTVHFDPDSFMSRGILTAGRPLVLFALMVGFLWSAGDYISQAVFHSTAVQAAETNNGPENLIPGVSQAKTWGAAGMIVFALLGFAAAIVALVDTMARTVAAQGITSLASTLDLAGLGTEFARMDAYFPLYAALTFTVMRAGLPYVVTPMYVLAVTVLKFAKA